MPTISHAGSINTLFMLALLALTATSCDQVVDSHGQIDPALKPVLKIETRHGLVVPVTIAGQRYRFFLATGSNFTILDQRIASGQALSMAMGEMLFANAPDDELGVCMDFLERFERYALLPSDMLFCFDASTTVRRL